MILIVVSIGALFVLLASVAKCYSKASQKPPVAMDDEALDPEDQSTSSDADSDATVVLPKHSNASAFTIASPDEVAMRSSLLGPAAK
jgi:hypothetical protein